MKLSYLFVIVFGITMLGCGGREQPTETAARLYANNTQAVPSPKKYSKPELGMPDVDFTNLCGQPNKTSASESVKGKAVKYQYKYSSERAMSGCWGTFTFVDSVLDSMHKD